MYTDDEIREKAIMYIGAWLGTTIDKTNNFDYDKHYKLAITKSKIMLETRKPVRVDFKNKKLKRGKGNLSELQIIAIKYILENKEIIYSEIKRRINVIKIRRNRTKRKEENKESSYFDSKGIYKFYR